LRTTKGGPKNSTKQLRTSGYQNKGHFVKQQILIQRSGRERSSKTKKDDPRTGEGRTGGFENGNGEKPTITQEVAEGSELQKGVYLKLTKGGLPDGQALSRFYEKRGPDVFCNREKKRGNRLVKGREN